MNKSEKEQSIIDSIHRVLVREIDPFRGNLRRIAILIRLELLLNAKKEQSDD